MNQFHKRRHDIRQWIAGRTAKPMFFVSLLHLICLACMVVLWVDVPSLHRSAHDATIETGLGAATGISTLERVVLGSMMAIWPIVILESVVHWLTRPWDQVHRKYHWFALAFCICPALRMCARSPEMGHRMWLPAIGWRRADDRLRRRLERRFSIPMIVIALMIMPILIIEFFMKSQVADYAWLRLFLHLGTGVIWFAFAAEFILMVSVTERKFAYCKKHWIDLAIILLPLFSFLRSLRALRATRVANVMRIPQISKLARVYRLRGTAVKAVEALILLGVFHRWTRRNPDKVIAKMELQLEETELEAKRLRRQIAKLRARREAAKPDQILLET